MISFAEVFDQRYKMEDLTNLTEEKVLDYFYGMSEGTIKRGMVKIVNYPQTKVRGVHSQV